MELLFLILIKCLPSQLVVSVASPFHEWLNFGTLKPRPKADNVLCLETFQRQPGEGTIWIFGWECPVRTLKTLSLFSCTKNPTSFNKNRVMGPRQNHSFFLHQYCTIFGSIPDQKPVIPIHSSKFKSPFHSSSQEPKKPIRPSLRRNGSKILGEKKKRSTQTKHPTFITLRAVVYIPSLPGKMKVPGLGIVLIFSNFYAWEIICMEFLRSYSDVIWRGNQW